MRLFCQAWLRKCKERPTHRTLMGLSRYVQGLKPETNTDHVAIMVEWVKMVTRLCTDVSKDSTTITVCEAVIEPVMASKDLFAIIPCSISSCLWFCCGK